MKLRSKLKVSFLVMILLPIVMCSCAISVIMKYQTDNIMDYYQVEGDHTYDAIYSPISLLGKMTNNVYNEMNEVAIHSPSSYEDAVYLDELSYQLKERLSSLVLRKNGVIIYSSSEMSYSDLYTMLPKYGDVQNNSDVGSYQGEYQSLIKQIDYNDSSMNYYSISIVTSLEQVVPQIRVFITEGLIAIILILFFTSSSLNIWIYSSVIRPLDRLKLATQNIKEGNLDFELPIDGDDEIDNLCQDFEEMRVILKASAEDKMQSDVEEKELIRNISHDLKTPLTAIKGYVEGLMDGVADTPEKREKYLKTIFNKVSDMDKLIDELTIYSRIDTNRIPYVFKKIHVKDYFDDCYEEIGTELEARGIEVAYVNHISDDVVIMADAEQMKRVINNIISNCVKYVADRSPYIKMSVSDNEDEVSIDIEDNGKGISEKNLSKIFERFYRADASRNSTVGGSGIGLAIVKKIVEDHNGQIWAESTENIGTTMHLKFRKYKEEEKNEQSFSN